MDKKYVVQDVTWTEGLERLRDPMPRRLYRAGDVIELDEKRESVAHHLASGLIKPYVEEVPEPMAPEEPKKRGGDK